MMMRPIIGRCASVHELRLLQVGRRRSEAVLALREDPLCNRPRLHVYRPSSSRSRHGEQGCDGVCRPTGLPPPSQPLLGSTMIVGSATAQAAAENFTATERIDAQQLAIAETEASPDLPNPKLEMAFSELVCSKLEELEAELRVRQQAVASTPMTGSVTAASSRHGGSSEPGLERLTQVINHLRGDMLKHVDMGFAMVEKRVDAGFASMEMRVDARFTSAEKRVDAGFASAERRVDARFTSVEKRVDAGFDSAERRVDARFDRVNWKLDVLLGLCVAFAGTVLGNLLNIALEHRDQRP